MARLLLIATLILAGVLFPPSALALISQNALPGEPMYPIKRILEKGILAAAGINPTTKALFSASLSDNRFKEATGLLAKGEEASGSLTELVDQTSVALEEIRKVSDEGKKQELITKLSEQIDSYNQGLGEAQQTIINSNPQAVASSAPSPKPVIIPSPTSSPTSAIALLQSRNSPSPVVSTQPSAAPATTPSSAPSPSIAPSPAPRATSQPVAVVASPSPVAIASINPSPSAAVIPSTKPIFASPSPAHPPINVPTDKRVTNIGRTIDDLKRIKSELENSKLKNNSTFQKKVQESEKVKVEDKKIELKEQNEVKESEDKDSGQKVQNLN